MEFVLVNTLFHYVVKLTIQITPTIATLGLTLCGNANSYNDSLSIQCDVDLTSVYDTGHRNNHSAKSKCRFV